MVLPKILVLTPVLHARWQNYYRRHKILAQRESETSHLPALGENALPEYNPCSHAGAPRPAVLP